jgi:hypothetical protein
LDFLLLLCFLSLEKRENFSLVVEEESALLASSSVVVLLVEVLEVLVVGREGRLVLPATLWMLARLREEVKGLEEGGWEVRRNILKKRACLSVGGEKREERGKCSR